MKFISSKNTYEFDSINFKDNLIALYIESQYIVFGWQGDVEFFKDGNGVGESWIDPRAYEALMNWTINIDD